jgi:alginate O-acetyltransferase complex protein AlgI
MAVGLALMLGFLFIKNFDDPYRSESITDFWRHWHISLSTWLRDYLYVPLGGNRSGETRAYANLMIVTLLGGLWHGASWNLVLWGFLHGSLLAAERWGRTGALNWAIPRQARVAVTFFAVCLGWVFFRAETLGLATGYLRARFGAGTTAAPSIVPGLIYTRYRAATFVACAVAVWGLPQVWTFTQRLTPLKAAVCLGTLLFSIAFLRTQAVNPFLYYQV